MPLVTGGMAVSATCFLGVGLPLSSFLVGRLAALSVGLDVLLGREDLPFLVDGASGVGLRDLLPLFGDTFLSACASSFVTSALSASFMPSSGFSTSFT